MSDEDARALALLLEQEPVTAREADFLADEANILGVPAPICVAPVVELSAVTP